MSYIRSTRESRSLRVSMSTDSAGSRTAGASRQASSYTVDTSSSNVSNTVTSASVSERPALHRQCVVAAVQMRCDAGAFERNCESARKLCANAARDAENLREISNGSISTDNSNISHRRLPLLIVLPEMFPAGYSFRSMEEAWPHAERLDKGVQFSRTMRFLAEIATKYDAWVCCTLLEAARVGESAEFLNTFVLVDPCGQAVDHRISKIVPASFEAFVFAAAGADLSGIGAGSAALGAHLIDTDAHLEAQRSKGGGMLLRYERVGSLGTIGVGICIELFLRTFARTLLVEAPLEAEHTKGRSFAVGCDILICCFSAPTPSADAISFSAADRERFDRGLSRVTPLYASLLDCAVVFSNKSGWFEGGSCPFGPLFPDSLFTPPTIASGMAAVCKRGGEVLERASPGTDAAIVKRVDLGVAGECVRPALEAPGLHSWNERLCAAERLLQAARCDLKSTKFISGDSNDPYLRCNDEIQFITPSLERGFALAERWGARWYDRQREIVSAVVQAVRGGDDAYAATHKATMRIRRRRMWLAALGAMVTAAAFKIREGAEFPCTFWPGSWGSVASRWLSTGSSASIN